MLLRFEAQLGDKKFSEIAPELILRDIVEIPAAVETSTVRFANRPGQRVSSIVRTSLSVRLVYVIRSKDIQRRMEIRDLVAAWAAKGGALKINTRPGKKLLVVCENIPALESSLRWTQDLSLTLTAYVQPYWLSENDAMLAVQTQYYEEEDRNYFADVINPNGNAGKAPATFTLINNGSDALKHLKVLADNTFIELKGMQILPNMPITAMYNDGILEILDFFNMSGDNSLLMYRTPESHDDLMLEPGRDNQIIVWADQPVSGSISATERWL